MSWLDIVYLLLLIASIPLGVAIKSCQYRTLRELICLTFGVSITLALNGLKGSLHSLFTIVINFLILKCFHKSSYSALISFLFTFAYLLFYRSCTFFGLPAPPKHSNAVQLLVTLRMISLAFETRDSLINKNSLGVESLDTPANKAENRASVNGPITKNSKCSDEAIRLPSFFNVISYGYCYIGLLTGPFYTYKTFQDMLVMTSKDQRSTFVRSMQNLKLLPFLAVVYLLLKGWFPLENLKNEEFFNSSLFGCVYTITFTSMWFRWRFYIGWLLAESSCISCGLGAYPAESEPRSGAGPSKLIEPSVTKISNIDNFETIHNISFFNVELGSNMKIIMRDWNMTVQWWMSTYVYKKLPFKSYYGKLATTLAISAFWHGIHPGYYLSFLSAIFVVFSQKSLDKTMTSEMDNKTRYYYDWISWFFVFRYIDLCGAVPFMLLEFGLVWRVWTKIYFLGHVLVLVVMVIPLFIRRKKPEKKEQ